MSSQPSTSPSRPPARSLGLTLLALCYGAITALYALIGLMAGLLAVIELVRSWPPAPPSWFLLIGVSLLVLIGALLGVVCAQITRGLWRREAAARRTAIALQVLAGLAQASRLWEEGPTRSTLGVLAFCVLATGYLWLPHVRTQFQSAEPRA
jgi:hypothetical protein